jgi:hypothetical protein
MTVGMDMVSTAGRGDRPERGGRTAFAVFLTDSQLTSSSSHWTQFNPGKPGILILEESPCHCPFQNGYDCCVRESKLRSQEV